MLSNLFEYLQAVFFVISIFIIGDTLIHLFFSKFFNRNHFFIRLAFDFALGNFFLILVLTILYYFGLGNLANFNLYLILITPSLIIFILKIKINKNLIRFHKELLTILALLLFFSSLIKESLFSFLYAWDTVAIWFLKAKALFLTNSFEDALLFNAKLEYLYSHKAYPLGLPLIVAFFYRIIGSINDQAIKFYYLSFYLVIFLFFLGLFFQKKTKFFYLKVLSLFSYFLSPVFIMYSNNGYSDLPLGFVFLLLFYLYCDFLENKKDNLLKFSSIFACIMAGLALTIKYEALPFVIFAFVFFTISSLLKKQFKFNYSLVFYFILSITPFSLWYLYVRKNGLNLYAEESVFNFIEIITRGKTVTNLIITELLDTSRFGLFFWIILGFLVFSTATLLVNKEFKKVSVIILPILQFSFYIAFYLITPFNFTNQFFASFERLFLQLMPLIFLIFIKHLEYFEDKNLI
ncbi:MAG: hypothetical protein KatS3mg091_080 [Patescibacteria group bacterium]|nr:MAG: hypothetical protein KatS3mg091_080 [Patescibacteria group bacterium]